MSAFADAIDDLFADPNMAVTVLYQGRPVRALARRPDLETEFGDTVIVSASAVFELRVAEVPTPVAGDAIVLDGETYIVRAYAEGAVIRSRHGYFLAIPTPAAGKYGDGRKKITPGGWERRHGTKLKFVFRRAGPSLLVAENRRARTGKRGGFGKASESALRTGRGLATVPMFILVPQVTVRKRLDVAGAAQKWIAELPRLVVRNWREPGRG